MKIGLIGCGEIAQAHAHHIMQSNDGHTIVGVCDIDATRGRRFAKQFGIGGVYSALDPFLEQHRPDVVHVLTPPQTHAALASRMMEAGCNVLVEKPMAISTEQADHMIAVANANRVKLCVNHNLLFDPVILRARALLCQGAIGELVCVDMHYGFNVDEASGQEWVSGLPGGMLQNLAPHPLYLALEFIDDPIHIHVSSLTAGTLGPNRPDEVRVTMEGRRVIGTVAISLRAKPNIHVLRLSGTKAIIHVDLASKLLWVERLRALPRAIARGVMNVEVGAHLLGGTFANAMNMVLGRLTSYQGLGTLIHKFYRSIETDAPSPVTRESARRVVDVFDRIRAELGDPVAL